MTIQLYTDTQYGIGFDCNRILTACQFEDLGLISLEDAINLVENLDSEREVVFDMQEEDAYQLYAIFGGHVSTRFRNAWNN